MDTQNWIDIIKTIAPTVLSLGLTYWVYHVLTKVIDESNKRATMLDKKVDKLEASIKELKKSENKWFQKYYRLANIITAHKCEVQTHECVILTEFNKFMEKEGETV